MFSLLMCLIIFLTPAFCRHLVGIVCVLSDTDFEEIAILCIHGLESYCSKVSPNMEGMSGLPLNWILQLHEPWLHLKSLTLQQQGELKMCPVGSKDDPNLGNCYMLIWPWLRTDSLDSTISMVIWYFF